jgi:hypothetical protein
MFLVLVYKMAVAAPCGTVCGDVTMDADRCTGDIHKEFAEYFITNGAVECKIMLIN